ncbi:MAG: hybrid sensor histidine kinase/response regulator [Allomuricauda sp.]
MLPKSKNKFALKIIASYLILGILVLTAGYFIYVEFKDYTEIQDQKDGSAKLLQVNTFLTKLYEAENLSKLALQHKKKQNILDYIDKVDSVSHTMDTLKLMLNTDIQFFKLDSIQDLLKQKAHNYAELRKLKVKDENNAPLDSLLEAFNQMEIDMGRITPEAFVPDFHSLPIETQNSIREYVVILNKNIPKNGLGKTSVPNIDSILTLSKSLLQEAKTENVKLERSMMVKELQAYKTDLELSQKLRSFVSGFEQEIILEIHSENHKKQTLLKRGSLLAWTAAILGFTLVCIFTFLIVNDYWKTQSYRARLEKEKTYSEVLLKSREQLISTVSHDLRSPLNSIKGYLELMEQNKLNSKQQNYIKNIQSSANFVEHLANDLLDFSQLEAGKIQISNSSFILSDLITKTASSFIEIQNAKLIPLEIEIEEILKKPILGDHQRIRQILTNLIGNAFKFTLNGSIKIKAFAKNEDSVSSIIIQIIDTGIGIPKEKQELIFKEFTQVANSNQENTQGYGLGLTISKKLTELLGGNLEVESEPNMGSVFTFSMPLKFAGIEVSKGKLENSSYEDGFSIVILDDDENLLKLLHETCKTHGIIATTFLNFKTLKQKVPTNYNAILTDIQMPKTNGFEVVKAFKERNIPHYKDQPIIAMTGQREFSRNHYLQAGFDDVLLKPFSSSVLLKALGSSRKSFDSKEKNISVNPSTILFNTETISTFLDSKEALGEVLATFLRNTDKNLLLLSKAVQKKNYRKMRDVSHKMLPMFRQLKIESAICYLEHFEHITSEVSFKKAFKDLELLKCSIFNLKEEMQAYLTILSADNN